MYFAVYICGQRLFLRWPEVRLFANCQSLLSGDFCTPALWPEGHELRAMSLLAFFEGSVINLRSAICRWDWLRGGLAN